MNIDRSSGILLHPSSLPGKHGIGSLGKEAFRFVDFLERAGQKLWQVLPLGPTGYGDSPYQCFSSVAGNPLLINLDLLYEQGLLTTYDMKHVPKFPVGEVDYATVIPFKFGKLEKAFTNLQKSDNHELKADFESFCHENASWIEDYAMFMALKNYHNHRPWQEWEPQYLNREPEALDHFKNEHAHQVGFRRFIQYLFFRQWAAVKNYANSKGIKIIGDIPIYVSADSVETWTQPEIFLFDERKNPVRVSGVPPDYFSKTGQLWGNPIYNWEHQKHTDFAWWKDRIRANLQVCDIVRIDHFRGFSEFWAVPFGEETAINGEWWPCPGHELFESLKREFGELPIIAEDLGVITDDVVALRERFGFPGMKILQFAFDSGEDNNYLPHTYDKNFVVYTGTHDNDTLASWYKEASVDNKKTVREYLGHKPENGNWDLIRLAHASTANMSVIPLQDYLGLGSDARMNTPGTTQGNWKWRFKPGDLNNNLAHKMGKMTKVYGR